MPYLSQNLKPLRILKGFKLLWNSFFIAVIIAVIFFEKKFWIEDGFYLCYYKKEL